MFLSQEASNFVNYAKSIRKLALMNSKKTDYMQASLQDISKVILILSSSRGGSSLVFELIRNTNQVLSLDGEHIPYYKLNGYSFPFNSIQSDEITFRDVNSLERVNELSTDILSSLSVGIEKTKFEFEELKFLFIMRLPLQWPQLNLTYEKLHWYINKAYESYTLEQTKWNHQIFFIYLLKFMSDYHPEINPFYYDLNPLLLKNYFPQHTLTKNPPNPFFLIEEPPFVVPKVRRSPTLEEIREKPLLLKAPVDAYRLSLLKNLFPNADFQIIHLTRNPAATINGLYEGWLDRGFFSHNLKTSEKLSISSYSEKFDWGKYWWNYDLPPNWKSMIKQPLEYICGFQWFSAHKAILENLYQENLNNVLRVKFENLLLSDQQRYSSMAQILKFIGIDFDDSLKSIIEKMPVVMATSHPKNKRWINRQNMLYPVIRERQMIELSNFLGYSLKDENLWL